ncbi:endolytic transglycosylase MltG [Glaciihabitans sp. UYNi722]|uniref:endolytic transglycosylase MltG n=1 Tax=Glaciihabitans sp. UYNi722 TaxID=3156344 RepID=UPI003394CFE9
MVDDPSWDDIFNSQPRTGENADPTPEPAPQSRREARERQPKRVREGRVDEYGPPPQKKKKRRLGWLWVLLVFVVVLGGAATAVWFTFEPQIRHVLGWEDSNDYVGSGSGKVIVTVKDGQIGGDVAKTLAASGVTKTYDAFYGLLLKTPSVQFQPGSYQLKKQMSAKSALAAITDPKNKVLTRVILPEGITVKGVITRLSDISQSTGVTREQLEAAAADYKSFGLPAEAPSLEGYLFPATYNVNPGLSAHQILDTFVKETFKRLDAAGVAPADRHRILTLAALTQKEGGSTADFLKVARVWDNRIADKMNLQSDATVSYGVGGTTLETTAAQRADKSNPYNTYANPGLPVGPISNPGQAAIDATLHPADGSWIYFVVVNCSTGETAFSDTLAQHEAANKQLGQWQKEHPGGCN